MPKIVSPYSKKLEMSSCVVLAVFRRRCQTQTWPRKTKHWIPRRQMYISDRILWCKCVSIWLTPLHTSASNAVMFPDRDSSKMSEHVIEPSHLGETIGPVLRTVTRRVAWTRWFARYRSLRPCLVWHSGWLQTLTSKAVVARRCSRRRKCRWT